MSPRRRKRPLVSPREWRIFWITSLGLAVVTGVTTFLVLLLNKPEEPQNVLPSQSPFRSSIDDTISRGLMLSDFDLPAPGGEWLSRGWLFSREGGTQAWTKADVAPFWIAPEDLSLSHLPELNDQKIQKLWDSVP